LTGIFKVVGVFWNGWYKCGKRTGKTFGIHKKRKDQYFVTVFFDIFDENKVTSYLLIDCETEKALHGYYGKPSEELRISFEREVFVWIKTL